MGFAALACADAFTKVHSYVPRLKSMVFGFGLKLLSVEKDNYVVSSTL